MSADSPLLLFLCSGNICRSPFAEAAARELLWDTGIEVASAGTYMIEGKPSTPEGIAVAEELGFDLSGHRSRSATPGLLDSADRIYGMDTSHIVAAEETLPGAAIELLDPSGAGIDDPYQRSIDVYHESYRRIIEAIEARIGEWRDLVA